MTELDGIAARVAALPGRVNGDATMLRRGRLLNAALQLVIGADSFLIEIADGRVVATRRGGVGTGDVALVAEPDIWRRLLAASPPAGDHDFLAFVKRRELRLVGDLHPLMTHLLYVKEVLARLREDAR